MNKTKAMLCMVGLSMLLATTASAGTFHWKDNASSTDWTDGNNYEEGTAPSASDTVVVGNATVYLSDSDMDSFNLAASLAVIQPTNANSKIVFTVSDASKTLTFGAAIRKQDSSTLANRSGTVVKKGAGTVELTNNTSTSAYMIDLVVEEGILSVSTAGKGTNTWFGDLSVSNNASFYTRTTGRTVVNRVYGEGTITNRSNYAINVRGGTAADPVVLTPWLSKVAYYSFGRVNIWRTDNRSSSFTVYSDSTPGVTGFYSIGQKGQPSSIGIGSAIETAEGGGTFLYLGDGNETGTDKDVIVENANHGPTEFDAGAYGGLTFTGYWVFGGYAGMRQGMGQLVLSGSNTHECVIAGSIRNATLTNALGETGFSFHITKKGTGTWRLSDISDTVVRSNYTGIAVEEGTLKYDSLADAGVMCSLGMATNLYESYRGAYNETYRVPYAFRLGSAVRDYPDAALATFEYSGTKEATCRTRPIALGGDAKLLNSSGCPFRFAGISAISNGVQNLVLGGDGTNDEIQNLTDGAAGCKLGVVKEGSGTWTLAMTNSFSGPLVVKGGTLKVRRDYQYTWYRLVVKDIWTRLAGATDSFKIGRIGLFDADGYRQNIGFTYNGGSIPANGTFYSGDPAGFALQPGEIGFGMPIRYKTWVSSSQYVRMMTNTGGVGDSSNLFLSRSSNTIDPENPDMWIMFDMRLTNGTPEIAYYDLAVRYGQTDTTSVYTNYNIRSWSLLGSTDGWNWNELHSIADSKSDDLDQKFKLPNYSNYWMAQNETTSGNTAATKHNTAKLQPISGHLSSPPPMPLANVESVSVSDGAVLEADGDITLSSFKVAANASAGTVKGFALAPNCTIDVADLPARPESFDLPIAFEGASPSDASWTLKVNGSDTTKYKLVVAGDKLRFIVKGMTVILR